MSTIKLNQAKLFCFYLLYQLSYFPINKSDFTLALGPTKHGSGSYRSLLMVGKAGFERRDTVIFSHAVSC